MIDIVTPTLWRGDKLAAYVNNVHTNTVSDHVVTFVAEPDDDDTIRAVERIIDTDPRVRLLLNTHTASVLGAFNTGAEHVTEPWWFGAGDDVEYSIGWDTIALSVLDEHPEAKVIGTNDLHHPNVLSGETATHMLINTEYTRTVGLTLDLGPGVACCEEYEHNYFDTECVAAARKRGVWQPCLASIVEHKHWAWSGDERDATYDHTWRNGDVLRGDVKIWRVRARKLGMT